MRVFHNNFKDIISIENLVASWREFKIGKERRVDVVEFERYLEDNLWDLQQSLADKTYRHGPYASFFIQDPKLRHIHKASVRDRVLHHAIVKHLNPIFEPTFIYNSYSCRVDKGTHRGVDRFVAYARSESNNFKRPFWVLKCDVRKFFASIDHGILLEILFKKVCDEDTQWLLREVVESFRSEFTVNEAEPRGLPIGNLTSQLFANVYLNELDQFMKHRLKERHYLRYADDFAILHTERDHCFKIIEPIREFLSLSLKLDLHPRKVSVRKYSEGVDFLGYICFPHFRIPRLVTEKRIFRRLREKAVLVKQGSLSIDSFEQTLQSYSGILSHSNSFELKQELENRVFFWLTTP
jgi:retron-type reverse transcriptase